MNHKPIISDGGHELLNVLISGDSAKYHRPNPQNAASVRDLFAKAENALTDGANTLALAYVLELITLVNEIRKSGSHVSKLELSRLTRSVIGRVEANFSETITVERLAAEFTVSPSYLSRTFKREVGVGIHEYLTSYRILKAAKLLSDLSVAETCYMCGFSDSSHFIATFKRYMGMTPNEYKKLDMGT